MKVAGPLASLFFAMVSGAVCAQAVRPELKPVEFDQLDTNHDGKLSLLEARSVPDLEMDFQSLDVNHDGYLTPDEFQAWPRARKTQASPRDPSTVPGGSNGEQHMPAH